MALVPWIALLLTFSITNRWVFAPAPVFAALTLGATVLHPAGRDLFRSFSVARVNWVMLALVIMAAVPLLAFAVANLRLQMSVANDHAALGHYGFMAAFSLTVIAVAVIASLRPVGWKLSAWTAGLLPALLGITSLIYPNIDSSLDRGWSMAAIVWSVALVAAAVLTRNPRPLP
jgi:hypothetical protein